MPAILVLAALTFVGWLVLGPEPRRDAGAAGGDRGADHRLPVRARPGDADGDHGRHRQSRRVRHPDPRRRGARERPAIDTIVLDKTGTLTRGKPAVTPRACAAPTASSEAELLRLAAAAEVGSEHPLGEAIVERARELGLDAAAGRALPGLAGPGRPGARRRPRGAARQPGAAGEYGIGWTTLAELAREALAAAGATPMYVAVDDEPAGLIGVADTLQAGVRARRLRSCRRSASRSGC